MRERERGGDGIGHMRVTFFLSSQTEAVLGGS